MDAARIRPHDILPTPDGLYPCPYLGCDEMSTSARDRITHMLSAHRLETEARLSAIEEMLGGEWRTRASCRGMEGFLTEPSSREKATARESGFREPTRGERRAFQVCLSCPVRTSCARASLQPAPASVEAPTSRSSLYEETGVWAGSRPEERRMTIESLGNTQAAVEALIRLGERMAQEYPP